MAVLSKEASAVEVKLINVPVPEIRGNDEDYYVVRPYDLKTKIKILEACTGANPDGSERIDKYNYAVASFCAAVVEPKFTFDDTEIINNLPGPVIDRCVEMATGAVGTNGYFERFKEALKLNPYVLRVYLLCVEHLGRLPSELDGIEESEFIAALAALDIKAEAEAEAFENARES